MSVLRLHLVENLLRGQELRFQGSDVCRGCIDVLVLRSREEGRRGNLRGAVGLQVSAVFERLLTRWEILGKARIPGPL